MMLLLGCTLYAEAYDWEIIDRNGIVLHSIPKAEYVSRLSEGIIAVEYEKEFAFLNSSFDEIHRARGGLPSFAVLEQDRIGYHDFQERKYGFLNRKGEVVIEPGFDDVEGFTYGYAIVGTGERLPPRPKFDYRIIDLYGNYASPLTFSSIKLSVSIPGKGIALVKGRKKRCIIELRDNEWVLNEDIRFNTILMAGDTLIFNTDNSEGYGFMSWEGEVFVDPIYTAVWAYSDSWFIVDTSTEKSIMVDKFGQRKTTIDGLVSIYHNRYAFFRSLEKMGVYDLMENRIIIPPEYDSIITYSDDVFTVELNGKKGYVDLAGKTIGKIEYDRANYFYGGVGVAAKEIDAGE